MMNRQLRAPARKDPLGPYAYADVPSGIPPSQLVLLDNGEYVRRSAEGILVPAFVIDNGFTLLTSIDAETYEAGSPPTGWGESGGGTIDVNGGYIRIIGASGSAGLTYTMGSFSSGDTVVVVLDGYATAGPGGTDMAAVRLLDSIENGNTWFRLEYGDEKSYMLSGASFGGVMTAVDSRARVCVAWGDETFWAVELDGYRTWAAERGFTGSSGNDQVQFYVNSDADTSTIYIKTFHIYKGVLP